MSNCAVAHHPNGEVALPDTFAAPVVSERSLNYPVLRCVCVLIIVHRYRRARGPAPAQAVHDAGYEQMTIRSPASDLGVGPMTLCRHVRDKDDLLDDVPDRLLLAPTWKPRAGVAIGRFDGCVSSRT
jgi:hypothetical protein